MYYAVLKTDAGAWQRFRHITLPQLGSVLFVIVLLRSIWMFTKFDTPWLMIQGGGAETQFPKRLLRSGSRIVHRLRRSQRRARSDHQAGHPAFVQACNSPALN